MKKLNLNQSFVFINKVQKITSFLLIFVAVIFIANSCTKEIEVSKDNAIQLRTEMTPEQRVAVFSPVVNGSFDATKSYTGQEAVLGVETVLNYKYGDFSKQFDETYSLKDTFIVAKEGGVITDRVVADICNQALQLMKCHYAGISETTKVELFADLNLISENNSQLQVALNNVVASASIGIGPLRKDFKEGDNWNAYRGTCLDPYYPSSAPFEIANYINFNLVGAPAHEAGEWFSDYEIVHYSQYPEMLNWWAWNPNDPNPGDWIIDCFMWWADFCNNGNDPCEGFEVPLYSSAYDNIMCIDWPEMNYYLKNGEFEAKKFEPILNKTFIYIFMGSSKLLGVYNQFFWSGEGTYAKRHVDRPKEALKQLGDCIN